MLVIPETKTAISGPVGLRSDRDTPSDGCMDRWEITVAVDAACYNPVATPSKVQLIATRLRTPPSGYYSLSGSMNHPSIQSASPLTPIQLVKIPASANVGP